jgi:5-methylcytosine-specific restriction protein A
LALEPRARLLPEERLEANLLLGDDEAVRTLIRKEEPGIAEERRAYLYGDAASRNEVLVRELQELYGGRCQLCLWDPVDRFGRYLCHGHHIQWLSRGGESAEDNPPEADFASLSGGVPGDELVDYAGLAFVFERERVAVRVNRHLG